MKLSTKLKNALHPGYSACKKCGGNWGWKKEATHMTSEHSGLFLFCEECDKIVTVEERWEALDEWKHRCLRGMTLEDVKYIINREFLEFPRNKKEAVK